MKKIFACLLSTLSAFTFADYIAPLTVLPLDPHRLSLTSENFYQYLSTEENGVEMRDKGVLYGARLGYDYLKADAVYAGVDGLFAAGRVKTKIQLPEADVSRAHRTEFFANAEGRLGYSFLAKTNFVFTPFGAFGWYYLRPSDDVSVHMDWLYGAAGLRLNYAYNSLFDLGLNGKLMRSINAKIRAKVNRRVDASVDHINFWGYEVGLPLTWHLGETKQWDIQFEPYFLKLNIKDDLYLAGARIGAGYRF